MNANRFKRAAADKDQIAQCTRDIQILDDDFVQLSSLFAIVGNENRLRIVFLIYQEDQMCPSDIAQILEMTVPAVSQHLKRMKADGILIDHKIGQTIYYSLNDRKIKVLLPVLNRLIAHNY